MASTHTARVPAGKLDDDMRRCGRAIVRVPGTPCEFSVEPGKVTFHDDEGMNYVMQSVRRIQYDDILFRVDTTRYTARATQSGFEGEAEFIVTDLVGSHDDFMDTTAFITSYMVGTSTPNKRKKVLLLCH